MRRWLVQDNDLLAAADVIEKAGHDPATGMYVEANDLSDSAFKMTYIQLSARGIPAYVRRMNSLSLEFFDRCLHDRDAALS